MDRDAPQNARDGPVAFERETQEKDPFGLDQFLTETKKGKKAIDDLGGRVRHEVLLPNCPCGRH